MSTLTEIKAYIELHYTDTRPEVNFELNGQTQDFKILWSDRTDKEFEKIIFELKAELIESNIFKIILKNKPVMPLDKMLKEHYVVIRNLEIDQIKLGPALYRARSQLFLDLEQQWYKEAYSHGFRLEGQSENQTVIPFDGFWEIKFDNPAWKWICNYL